MTETTDDEFLAEWFRIQRQSQFWLRCALAWLAIMPTVQIMLAVWKYHQ